MTTFPQSHPDYRAEVLGYRPAFPIVVTTVDATDPASVVAANVPYGGHFIVSASYTGIPTETFYDNGAGANYIGTRIAPATLPGPDRWDFRVPFENEVVWHVTRAGSTIDTWNDEGLLRFRDLAWKVYRSWPERALSGSMAFDALDPDGVYRYYMRIVGALMYELGYDNKVIGQFIDPRKCPEQYLGFLAARTGLDLDVDTPIESQRIRIEKAVPEYKLKGLSSAVTAALHWEGYAAYALEVWFNPSVVQVNSANPWTLWLANTYYDVGKVVRPSPITASKYYFVCTTAGTTAGAAPTWPITLRTTVNDGTAVWTAIRPNWNDPYYAPQDIQDYLTSIGLMTATHSDVSTLSGLKGDDVLELPHGYLRQVPTYYVPSSRVSIHITNLDGSPVDTGLTYAEALALKKVIAGILQPDILAAHVDIHHFSTDYDIGTDGVEMTDSLTWTEIP